MGSFQTFEGIQIVSTSESTGEPLPIGGQCRSGVDCVPLYGASARQVGESFVSG